MKAWSNDKSKKDFYVKRMNKHIELDNLIQKEGWKEGKGCFIGCTLENYSHEKFEGEGIGPEWLAHLCDSIFEGLNKEESKWFADNFYKSMAVGIDLELVKKDFLLFMINENLNTLSNLKYDENIFKDVKLAVDKSIDAVNLCKKYLLDNSEENRSAAYFAAYSVYSHAYCAANCAANCASCSASAVYSAAINADPAASTVASATATAAAASAAICADNCDTNCIAYSASAPYSAAFDAEPAASVYSAHKRYAEKLIELVSGGTYQDN